MLRPGDVVNDTYVIDSEIGRGSLGVIYKAYHTRLQKYVCLKRIMLDKVSSSRFRIEVDTLKDVSSQYLPKVYDYIQYYGDVYTVMDYIDGRDMKYYSDCGYQFSEEELVKWLRQLCSALTVIHNHNPMIVHSDIKPDNILINSEGNVCLIDFNIAGGQGITKDYTSPEQYAIFNMLMSGDPRAVYYCIDGRSDIYSLGMTFYFLITRVVPNVTWEDIPKITTYSGLSYSEAFLEIIDRMTERDVEKRFSTAEEVLAALDYLKYSNSRYRKYIIFQILISIVCILILVTGVWMIIRGENDILISDFQTDYHNVTKAYRDREYDQVEEKGYELLNSSRYKDLLMDKDKCEIYHMMGNCSYNNGDYQDAVSKLANAMKYKDNYKNKSTLYADYSVALVKARRPDEALKVITEASGLGIDDTNFLLTESEIAYLNDDFTTAVQKATKCIEETVDNYKKSRCYSLLGDIYFDAKKYKESSDYYEASMNCGEMPDTIRKYVSAMTQLSKTYSSSDAMRESILKKAEICMRKLYKGYSMQLEDYINLGVLNNTLGDYEFGIRVLNDGIQAVKKGVIKPGDNEYKLYLYLALIYKNMGKIQETADNASKAMQICKNKDPQDEEYSMLRSLYDAYC